MTTRAVDEDELAHGPADRFDRVFLHVARVVQERDVRGKIRVRSSSQALSRQRGAKYSPKRAEFAESVISKQDEWTTAGLPSKADGAVEQNLKRLHPHFGSSLARHPQTVLGQATKEEERDV